jgi:hypothetical protein
VLLLNDVPFHEHYVHRRDIQNGLAESSTHDCLHLVASVFPSGTLTVSVKTSPSVIFGATFFAMTNDMHSTRWVTGRVIATNDLMKHVTSTFSLILAGLCGAVFPANGQVNVTQYHNHSSRDGLYIDSAFTQSAAANLTRDLNFDGTISGIVYAQPLYVEGGAGPMVIAVTMSNNVYALNSVTGNVIWQRNLGTPVPGGNLACNYIGSMGILGTPAVDLPSRALFVAVMATPGSSTVKHYL